MVEGKNIMNKVLTISIAAYNVEKYLDKCLRSFSDERFNDTLEVLIVNDGSKDKTPEIAESYVNRYPKIFRLIDQENGGHGSTIMTGIMKATGKYFRIVDGDDWIDTENLLKLVDVLKTKSVDAVITPYYLNDLQTGESTLVPLPKQFRNVGERSLLNIQMSKSMGHYFCIHCMTISSSLLKNRNITLLKNTFYEDAEYVVKCLSFVNSIAFLNIPIYYYLVNNATQSCNVSMMLKRYDHHDRVLKECVKFYQNYILNEKSNAKSKLVVFRISELMKTQFKIALVVNTNYVQGNMQANELKKYAMQFCPQAMHYSYTKYRIYKILRFVAHILHINLNAVVN